MHQLTNLLLSFCPSSLQLLPPDNFIEPDWKNSGTKPVTLYSKTCHTRVRTTLLMRMLGTKTSPWWFSKCSWSPWDVGCSVWRTDTRWEWILPRVHQLSTRTYQLVQHCIHCIPQHERALCSVEPACVCTTSAGLALGQSGVRIPSHQILALTTPAYVNFGK